MHVYMHTNHGCMLALGNYVKERNKRNIDLIRAIVENEKKNEKITFLLESL